MNHLSKNLNILAVLPHSIGGRLTISSIIDGFVANNWNVIVFDELYQSDSNFLNIIKENKFDFIVGYDFSGLQLKLKHNLACKCINYFSDEIDKPTSADGYQDYKNLLNQPNNFNFYWDNELCKKMCDEIKNLFYMPHFVNTNIYKPLCVEKKYDLMFAGRLDTDYRLKFWLELVKTFPDITCAWYAIDRHYKDALSRCNDEDKRLIEKTYKGFIDNEKDMALAINESKIVLNMHSQGLSSFNYRTFQVLACSKLLISDYREEINMLNLNEQIITYKDLNEVKEKIQHYLYNEVDYNEVIKNARAKICETHDAKKCVKKMIEIAQI